MSNESIKQIAGNLETLTRNLDTIRDLMLTADDVGVSAAKCAGLVGMVQEQLQAQVEQLYSCQGEN